MRVNFKSAKVSHKEKKNKRIAQVAAQQVMKAEGDVEMGEVSKMDKLGLSKAKRQQSFKKNKKKSVQAQIAELRIQSKKFKKKDVSQKAEKGKIAKQIKLLKASISKSGEEQSSESD